MDIFYFFFHLGLNILRDSGILSFITTNYYPTATGGTKLRKDLQNRSKIINIVNFGELKIFDSAQGQHNMITILQKTNKATTTKIYNFISKENFDKFESLQECLNSREITSVYESDNIYEGEQCYIRLSATNDNKKFDKIFNKISGNGKHKLLGQICNINQGIVSGADKVTYKHLSQYNWKNKGIKKALSQSIFQKLKYI